MATLARPRFLDHSRVEVFDRRRRRGHRHQGRDSRTGIF
jgi:hypothetical protein